MANNAPRMSWRDFDGVSNVGGTAYGGLNYDPGSPNTSYDNFGSAPVGSSFIIYRAICNNWDAVGTSATAENIQFTLHSGVHGETTGSGTNWREQDGTDPEGQLAVAGAYSGQANDSSGLPPSVTQPYTDQNQNQWAIGGDAKNVPALPSQSGCATISTKLWTSVRVTHVVTTALVTTPVVGENKTKIGFVSSASLPPGSYQYYTPVAVTSIPDQSGLALEIDTVIDPQYAGPGNLYARFHVKYTWV